MFNVQAMMGENEPTGVISTDGQLWQDQRRFALKFLRDFGLGKNKMQKRILEEVQTLIEKINFNIKSGQDEHDLFRDTDIAVGSVSHMKKSSLQSFNLDYQLAYDWL
jgi:hypothetical protein